MRPAGWRLKIQRRLWLPIGCTYGAKNKKLKPSKTDVSIAFGTFKNLGVPCFIKFCDEKFFGRFFWLHMGG